MKFPYDDDIARAIGYVSIYGAYIEDELATRVKEAVMHGFNVAKIEQFKVAEQANDFRRILRKLFSEVPDYSTKDYDKNRVDRVLREVKSLAYKRNRVLHSVYIGSSDGRVTQKSSRQDCDNEITTREIYKLAEEMYALLGGLIELQLILVRLAMALSEMNKKP